MKSMLFILVAQLHAGGTQTVAAYPEPGAVQGCTQGGSDERRSRLHVRGDASGGDVVAKGLALRHGAGMSRA